MGKHRACGWNSHAAIFTSNSSYRWKDGQVSILWYAMGTMQLSIRAFHAYTSAGFSHLSYILIMLSMAQHELPGQQNCMVLKLIRQHSSQEAYCLFGILSYARKYWRKSLCKKNATYLQQWSYFAISSHVYHIPYFTYRCIWWRSPPTYTYWKSSPFSKCLLLRWLRWLVNFKLSCRRTPRGHAILARRSTRSS